MNFDEKWLEKGYGERVLYRLCSEPTKRLKISSVRSKRKAGEVKVV